MQEQCLRLEIGVTGPAENGRLLRWLVAAVCAHACFFGFSRLDRHRASAKSEPAALELVLMPEAMAHESPAPKPLPPQRPIADSPPKFNAPLRAPSRAKSVPPPQHKAAPSS